MTRYLVIKSYRPPEGGIPSSGSGVKSHISL